MCETYDLRKSQCGSAGNCFFSRFRSLSRNAKKDQGRDIPPNAEPSASPRRLQLGQLGGNIPPNRLGQQLPPMVLQPDFRKVSGISTEIFRQLESVENDHDATTAAALGAVERRGEMLVRMLDPRQFSRPVQDAVRKFLSMQDGLHTVHFVEIVKRPGQTLGLYIREGNGVDRYDGVFISRIAVESAVFNSGCLGVGDEILAVNLVDVTRMSLDDVVILMSIPRRLVLTIRQRKGRMMSSSHSMLRSESKLPPVVVIKKELEDEQYDESNDENGHLLGQLGPGPYGHRTTAAQMHHTLSHPGYPGIGRGRAPPQQHQHSYQTQGQRIFGAQPTSIGGRQVLTPQHQHGLSYATGPSSIHSLSRHQQSAYQPHYANVPLQQHLPDVAEYASTRMARHDEFRLEAPQPPIRRNQYSADFDPYRPDPHPPPRPSSQQSGGYQPYEWYRQEQGEQQQQASTASISYQPPPPVITEQPRSSSVGPQHFQPFDRMYPKTLESLAEKVHTFYTGPRPQRQQNGRRNLPRTGSDHRLSLGRGGAEPQWYGSMPRQQRPGSAAAGDFRSSSGLPQSARYSAGLSARLGGGVPSRRKGPLDYASDSEAMNYPSIRSALPAATRRSLGLTNGRSNSLPRDLIRGRGGRKHNVRFDKRGTLDMGTASSMAGRRALLLAAGMDSQEESDGALSAPEMPLTPRRDRGMVTSSASVFTSAEYRAWLTRAPSTSAIYERLKTNRDFDLLQTQKAAKLTYSAENLTLLDRARTRTERQLKLLTESLERENLNNLAQWEAQQRQQEQQRPYYSYRTHLTSSTLTGADSTLARALAGRSPSASSALSALGIREPPAGAASSLKESLSSDPLRRLVGITPSRDLTTSATSADGRRSPSAALLHRISAEKDESLLRKEILSRSLIGRDLLSRESLKDDLAELDKSDKITARLNSVGAGPVASSLMAGRHVIGGGHNTATITTPQGGGSITSTGTGDSRLKLLTINPSEFSRYKIERPSIAPSSSTTELPPGATTPVLHPTGHSGILRVHLLAGRALRSTVKTTDASVRTRDLYCVLECDRVHKARTVVCTGDQNFDWDEIFDLDLVTNKELDFLIYSWDPQLRHRLCYKGSVNLIHVLSSPNTNSDNFHQLAIKVEPRGTLYVKLRHTPPEYAFKREPKTVGLFGANLANIVMSEDSGLNVPLIVQRCIEEIERRGLDIIGLYRLCGSATKKQALRESFERSPRSVDLSAENVPDINVISGVLKDYLRELPEPLLTKCLYQMLVDALSVCLPDDPEGNARLLFSIIECLPKPNRCTLLLILEHLSLVCSLSDRNKMGAQQLAQCFGPILMVQFDHNVDIIDFQPPIKVLQYLLETWPAKSVTTLLQTARAAGAGVEAVRKGPSLLGKGRPLPRSTLTSSHSPPSKASPSSLSESHYNITPSTTSSSLTTPPQTTSNYSITSEFSTTSVTSPTPSHHMVSTSSTRENLQLQHPPPHPLGNGGEHSDSEDDVFATVSVRNRASAFESTQPTNDSPSTTNGASSQVHQDYLYAILQQQSQEKVSNISSVKQFQQMDQPMMSPPHQQQQQMPPSSVVPPSPFMGRKMMGGGPPLPGRAERADSFEDGGSTTTTSSNSSNNSICSKRRLPSIPKSFSTSQEDNANNGNNGHTHSSPPQQPPQYCSPPEMMPDVMNNRNILVSSPPSSASVTQSQLYSQYIQNVPQREHPAPPQHPQYYAMEPPYPPPQMSSINKPVPPPPPPKPGSAMKQRLASSSDSEDYSSDKQDSPLTRPKSNGHSLQGVNETNGSGGSSGGSSTTTPTTVREGQQGPGSKGSSPGTTPLGTPPPVPPRLDRRPSQPSPTSSPPAMPPPVPPRLGRAAPVRTPSLDGREAFEVDCYTIKEENGEEDFLT